ncbi:carboxylate--amine ligase [Tetragenococcus halophilus]|uniref:carboxylate--amine ligase n=1 Tax=Tetragenococcus halophilus TaxID=51669 RepID=UPI00209B79A5|nr:carboxylate--amine ligase [Tetragenococcus halophilus]MCO8288364.1 carboxylate--amine ligase [Tetragenococcus halophilus]MCT8309637.1 carboxylate--amine ligase [Tetragenococcus halophilus]MDN6257487.1 carboxylate--amine ligase [Tetragenococcus halophilus]
MKILRKKVVLAVDTKVNEQFLPLLLGSDINVYGMARSFHEAYGTISEAHGAGQLSPTKYSKIVNVHSHPGFSEPEGFMKVMRELMAQYKDDPRKIILVPCGDGYTELITHNKEELSQRFICPTVDAKTQETLEDKAAFYETCEKYGLPYPDTLIITKDMVEKNSSVELPFGFPVALKPSDSVEYLDVDFEGRKKAFILYSQEEVDDILAKVYQAGYTSEMICQNFIPGDDSRMRVLNAYVDHNHNVRMMYLGHPLLEDPTPEAVGNYVAIMPDYNEKVFDQMKSFLEKIEYVGFANFDMKYDERDGEYKLFEINLRQGRSSFCVTLGGYNLAQYLVEDYVLETPFTETTYAQGDKLWLGVPEKILKQYIAEGPDKEQAMQYLAENKYGNTLYYKQDMNLKRYLLVKRIFYLYHDRYKKYFRKK